MSNEPMTAIPRPEHPRPDFVRETFFNLNVVWQFAFDDDDQGLAAGWMKPGVRLPLEITVPFAYQTRLSGLGPTDEIHPVIWYRRAFTVPQEMQGKRVLLRFGAVDYACAVYSTASRPARTRAATRPSRWTSPPCYTTAKMTCACAYRTIRTAPSHASSSTGIAG